MDITIPDQKVKYWKFYKTWNLGLGYYFLWNYLSDELEFIKFGWKLFAWWPKSFPTKLGHYTNFHQNLYRWCVPHLV